MREIIPGITINRDLKFDHHVNNLCKKAFQKRSVRAAQVAPSINIDKKE